MQCTQFDYKMYYEMVKRRALIYGNQKCFSKYLKYKFQDTLIFDVFKSFKNLNEELNVYSVIVFVIYTEEDLRDFFKVYEKGIPLIVCSFNKRISDVLVDLNNIFLLDTSNIRAEILDQLSFYLKEIMRNVQIRNTTNYKGKCAQVLISLNVWSLMNDIKK